MGVPIHLNALATTVPETVVTQAHMAKIMKDLFAEVMPAEKVLSVFSNAQVDKRHSCVPASWLAEPRSFEERNEAAIKSSVDLSEKITSSCLEQAGIEPDEISGIITVNSSNFAIPSVDALLMERMGLRRDIWRLHISGVACLGGTVGLARTAMIAKAEPGTNVLVLW